jgi:hypothetical protein
VTYWQKLPLKKNKILQNVIFIPGQGISFMRHAKIVRFRVRITLKSFVFASRAYLKVGDTRTNSEGHQMTRLVEIKFVVGYFSGLGFLWWRNPVGA